jgi:hypothetical protein
MDGIDMKILVNIPYLFKLSVSTSRISESFIKSTMISIFFICLFIGIDASAGVHLTIGLNVWKMGGSVSLDWWEKM